MADVTWPQAFLLAAQRIKAMELEFIGTHAVLRRYYSSNDLPYWVNWVDSQRFTEVAGGETQVISTIRARLVVANQGDNYTGVDEEAVQFTDVPNFMGTFWKRRDLVNDPDTEIAPAHLDEYQTNLVFPNGAVMMALPNAPNKYHIGSECIITLGFTVPDHLLA